MIHDGHKSCAAVEGERYYWHVLYIPVGRHCHTIPMALLACDGTASPMCGEATPAYQLECCCCWSVPLHHLDAELECGIQHSSCTYSRIRWSHASSWRASDAIPAKPCSARDTRSRQRQRCYSCFITFAAETYLYFMTVSVVL
jgi:hypothetical protein